MKQIILFLFLVVLIFPISGIPDEANNDITITILYDNYIYVPGTSSDWGFSCLIESEEKTVLFDTGTYSEILMKNVEQLGVDLGKVDLIVLSHIHRDHTGGLMSVLDKKIYLVMGGFHLMQHSKEQVKEIADEFRILGVEKCGATHCTGDQAIRIFKDEFEEDYIPMGVGRIINIE